MHFVVRSFRAIFVEGRFVPLVAVLGMLAMRVALFHTTGLPHYDSRMDNFLWEPVSHLFIHPWVSLLASTLSVLLIAWIISQINSKYNLLRSRSSLPFSVPLFLLSLHPYFLAMSGNYICIVFVLLALVPLLDSYQQPDAYLYSFRASILLATASLFQIYAIVLLPLWWIGERSMRGLQYRSFVVSLFGAFLVYFSLFSIYSFLEDIPRFILPFLRFASFSLTGFLGFSILEWVGVVCIGLFFIVHIIFGVKLFVRDKVLTLTLMRFLVYLIVFLLLFQAIYLQETVFFLLLSLVLGSYLIAYFYSKTLTKNHIFIAYGLLAALTVFYLSHILPTH